MPTDLASRSIVRRSWSDLVRRSEVGLMIGDDDLLAYMHPAGIQVDVRPRQSAALTTLHSGHRSQAVHREQVLPTMRPRNRLSSSGRHHAISGAFAAFAVGGLAA